MSDFPCFPKDGDIATSHGVEMSENNQSLVIAEID